MELTLPSFAHEVQPVMDIANIIIFFTLFFTLLSESRQYRRERRNEAARAARDLEASREAARRERERDNEAAAQADARGRAAFARALYRDYLRTALENPDLSVAEYDMDDRLATDKYDTFISIMLYAFDEMITGGQDILEYWTPVIEGQTEVHEKSRGDLWWRLRNRLWHRIFGTPEAHYPKETC